MEFRQVEHFLAVVEHGGVVRAAAALHLAQPSLSQSIRSLERELGTPLFHRAGRGLVPTAAGEELLKPARQLIRDLSTALASVGDLSGLHGGNLDLGATAAGYESSLLDMIGDLRKRFPKLTVRIREYRSESDVAHAVREGTVELGIGFLNPRDAKAPAFLNGLAFHTLATEELCVNLPVTIADAVGNPLPFDLLPDLPVIAVTNGALARKAVEAALRSAGRKTRLGVETAYLHAALPIVAAGDGMCWTTRAQAQTAAFPGVVSRAMDPPILLPLIVMHQQGQLAPAARAFLDSMAGGEKPAEQE